MSKERWTVEKIADHLNLSDRKAAEVYRMLRREAQDALYDARDAWFHAEAGTMLRSEIDQKYVAADLGERAEEYD